MGDAVEKISAQESRVESRVQKGANLVRRNALGRGLSSLMSVTAVSTKPVENVPIPLPPESIEKPSLNSGSIFYLSLEALHPNPSQPRRDFPEIELQELANSVRESGLIQPIIARKIGANFEIVAGERRYRASKLAGLKEVPVIVRDLTDRETLALGIVENVQRQDLNPIEEALAYQRLVDEFGETQSSVAQTVGKDRASVANALRLLKLAPEVRALLIAGALSAGHGRALLMIENIELQKSIAQQAKSESLSVRALEQLVQNLRGGKSPKNAGKPSVEKMAIEKTDDSAATLQQQITERIRRALGTKVQVNLTAPDKGEVKISFFSRDELESLLEKLER